MKPKQLLIDGYNLLAKIHGGTGLPEKSFEQDREALVRGLGRYAQRGKCAVTIVFDAWRQKGQLRQVAHREGVTVMYSEGGEKADQVIQQFVRSEGKDWAVVSSDHEVLAVAKAHGAFTIRSEEFARRLQELFRSSRSRYGSGSDGMEAEEEPGRSREKKGNPRKLPKKVRQRNRIMKRF